MTPEPNKAAENPNRWIYCYNIVVRMFEFSSVKFAKIEADWRMILEPDLRDANWNAIRIVLIAKDPDSWQEPALAQMLTISREEFDDLLETETRLFELIAAKIEITYRSIIRLLYENNPEQRVRISEYV